MNFYNEPLRGGGVMTEKSFQCTVKLILLTIKYVTELMNLVLIVSVCPCWIFSLRFRNMSTGGGRKYGCGVDAWPTLPALCKQTEMG